VCNIIVKERCYTFRDNVRNCTKLCFQQRCYTICENLHNCDGSGTKHTVHCLNSNSFIPPLISPLLHFLLFFIYPFQAEHDYQTLNLTTQSGRPCCWRCMTCLEILIAIAMHSVFVACFSSVYFVCISQRTRTLLFLLLLKQTGPT
jgi:hypothetical protein